MSIEQKIINTIKVLSAEGVQKANSGHPGLPLGTAAIAYKLWADNMKHNPKNPGWIDRDRFVLSAGHGSMLVYSLLHLFGYDLPLEELKEFRQWGSKTPGHPEFGHTAGVEVTTGPLGQGLANCVGFAIAEEYLANRFNKPGFEIVSHFTYALAGDGCMMEGISYEAASLAGTLGLEKLIVLYDDNGISIEGDTDLAFSEDVAKRFEAFDWNVIKVDDGEDTVKIDEAIKAAKRRNGKPTLIVFKTVIGSGCSVKEGKASAHGEPLGQDNLNSMKKCFGWPDETFHVPDDVRDVLYEISKKAEKENNEWDELFAKYRKVYPDMAAEWDIWFTDRITHDLLSDESFWNFEKADATRNASGIIINRLATLMPNLIGGSADLAPSTKTEMKGKGSFSKENRSGANLHFGVREHAMAAITNGLCVHGGLRPYCATFFVFTDYMKPAMRLSALMKQPVIYVLTHDSIGVGEDGPTHEPVEHLAALRCTPGFTVIRPADAHETAAAWYLALTRKDSPTGIVLTRQVLPLYDISGKEALRGGYILKDCEGGDPEILLIATGSEVETAMQAFDILSEKGYRPRVVSLPSFEIFDEQPQEYRDSVMPPNVRKRVCIEALVSFGWHKYAGDEGVIVSLDRFGASAPAKTLFEKFGFTAGNVVKKCLEIL